MANNYNSRGTLKSRFKQTSKTMVDPAPAVNGTLNSIYNGTSCFAHHKRFADNKNALHTEAVEQTKQFARLRFNIGIEAAKQTEIMK